MIKINVLLENYSINEKYQSKHGLSLLIDFNGCNILLDVGPDNTFIKNANSNNMNLQNIKYLFLSHNHFDHTGGINDFIKINNKAKIFLMDKICNKYFIKLFLFYFPMAIKLEKKYISRVIEAENDLILENKIYYMKNIVSKYKKPHSINIYIKKYQKNLKKTHLIMKVYWY